MTTVPESLDNGMVDGASSPKARFSREIQEWAHQLPNQVKGLAIEQASPFHWLFSKEGKPIFLLELKELPTGTTRVENSLDPSPAAGVRHIILWEDQWFTKRRIIEHRLKALLGISERIPARLTRVQRLDRPTTTAFLRANHLQDPVLSKLKYGLYLPQRYFRVIKDHALLPPAGASELLVAVATFAHPRVFQKETGPHRSYEFVRFANLAATTVVGGLDKLLKHFIRENQPDDIMTYADLEWSDGHSYLKLGFKEIGDTNPHAYWIDTQQMQRYPAHRLPEGIREHEAPEHGYLKIYNAGSRKFVKTIQR